MISYGYLWILCSISYIKCIWGLLSSWNFNILLFTIIHCHFFHSLFVFNDNIGIHTELIIISKAFQGNHQNINSNLFLNFDFQWYILFHIFMQNLWGWLGIVMLNRLFFLYMFHEFNCSWYRGIRCANQ